MHLPFSRRHLVLSGIGLALSGCRSRGPAGLVYVVQSGDTLSTIAHRSGLSVRQIAESNRLASNRLRLGQRLILPGITSLRAAPEPVELVKQQSVAPFRMVRRSEWGAQPLKPNHDPMPRVRHMTLHHTSEVPGMRQATDAEIVRKIAHVHRNIKGWADIGYHYLIGYDGSVYEGRPIHAQGAHVGGNRNKENLGISLIGDFQRTHPTGVQKRALIYFLDKQVARYGLTRHDVLGHRDLAPTACPGDVLYAWLQRYRAGTA